PEQALGPFDRLHAIVAPFGPRIERMLDGSVIAALTGGGAATDQAARAAMCALAMHAALPRPAMVVVMGRGVVDGPLPMGEVIERGISLLGAHRKLREGGGGVIRIDRMTAGLLDERFEVAVVDGEHQLRGKCDAETETPRTLMGKPTPC